MVMAEPPRPLRVSFQSRFHDAQVQRRRIVKQPLLHINVRQQFEVLRRRLRLDQLDHQASRDDCLTLHEKRSSLFPCAHYRVDIVHYSSPLRHASRSQCTFWLRMPLARIACNVSRSSRSPFARLMKSSRFLPRIQRRNSTNQTGANTANGAIAKNSNRPVVLWSRFPAAPQKTNSASADPNQPITMKPMDFPTVQNIPPSLSRQFLTRPCACARRTVCQWQITVIQNPHANGPVSM